MKERKEKERERGDREEEKEPQCSPKSLSPLFGTTLFSVCLSVSVSLSASFLSFLPISLLKSLPKLVLYILQPCRTEYGEKCFKLNLKLLTCYAKARKCSVYLHIYLCIHTHNVGFLSFSILFCLLTFKNYKIMQW